jgi:phospholipid/cholesterol/gamma-HCH transport system substrate-binding protein
MRALLIKVFALLAVTAVMATLLVVMFDNLQYQPQHSYHALFTDVSGLAAGDDVRAAGVEVGRVNSMTLQRDNDVLVTFTASDAASRTQPALSLDALFNGFQPLFQGLQPAQINQLSAELITVLQGEGGTIDGLLASIGSLTSTLANRDAVIGSVIDNLNQVLGTVSKHDKHLSDLVSRLQRLISGLAADRGPIGNSLGRIADLSGSLAGLLQSARPDVSGDVHQVDRLATVLNANSRTLNRNLGQLPGTYRLLNREGLYGSFFNFYLCGFQLRLTGPTGATVSTPFLDSEVKRCRS